ncbi:MAG TPA: VOC family protein [Cellulomonas sp.]
MTTMAVGMITFDTTDAVGLATWWARHVGGTAQDQADGWFVTVTSDGPTLAFQKVTDPTPGKNRIHLDLHVPDRAATAQELIADGATLVAEQQMPGFCWTVLADPDGNQFCLAQEDGA